jgi:hypothetical protein
MLIDKKTYASSCSAFQWPTFAYKKMTILNTFGRDIFFSAEDYTNVVVLDQSTVTFQKGGGYKLITICVVLDQNHGNAMFY